MMLIEIGYDCDKITLSQAFKGLKLLDAGCEVL